MLHFSVESVRKLNQDFMNGTRPNVQLSPEQRRIIDNFRPTRQEINEAYAKAIKVVNERAK